MKRREYIKECAKHGVTKHKERKEKGWRCSKCEYDAVKRRRKKMKKMLVEHHGGKCIVCGYSKCLRALTFHHRDPDDKNFSMNMSYRVKWSTLLEESAKCDLLCANCHAEAEDIIDNGPWPSG